MTFKTEGKTFVCKFAYQEWRDAVEISELWDPPDKIMPVKVPEQMVREFVERHLKESKKTLEESTGLYVVDMAEKGVRGNSSRHNVKVGLQLIFSIEHV